MYKLKSKICKQDDYYKEDDTKSRNNETLYISSSKKKLVLKDMETKNISTSSLVKHISIFISLLIVEKHPKRGMLKRPLGPDFSSNF